MTPGAPQAAAPGLADRIAALPALLADPSRRDEAFVPEFLAAVPPAQWQALLTQLAASAGRPLRVEHVEVTSPGSATVQVRFERALIGLRVAVEAGPPFRLSGMLLLGEVPPAAAEASVPAVLDALGALPGSTGAVVARLGTDAPVPEAGLASDRALSIGSGFKLVVLAEAIRAVAAGERGWDDEVTIGGAPVAGGRYAAVPAGTTVTLRALAEAMISVSDNSAADILIATLGRDRIEAMLPEVGVARPEGMRPFLAALELFKLKAMIAAGQDDWLRADETRRRALLAGPVATFPTDQVDQAFAPGRPLSIETVEWRASPDDMVRVLDWIRRHTESGPAAEARRILAMNPGIGPDAAAGWRYFGYKGGSEAGVIAMSFLLQRPSGEWLAVSAGWNDPAAPVDQERFVSLMARLVGLLRTEGSRR